jgi:hypothetical protein
MNVPNQYCQTWKDRDMEECTYCGTVTDSELLCNECMVNHWNKLCESLTCEACQIGGRVKI